MYPENHQQCWWFQKALALPRLFIRAKRGTKKSSPVGEGGSRNVCKANLPRSEAEYVRLTDEESSVSSTSIHMFRFTQLGPLDVCFANSTVACDMLPYWGRLGLSDCHICGGRAMTASGGFFDEPIGSACGMPQGGKCQATSTAGGHD